MDPKQLCSDPDPASHVHSGVEQDSNKVRSGSDIFVNTETDTGLFMTKYLIKISYENEYNFFA